MATEWSFKFWYPDGSSCSNLDVEHLHDIPIYPLFVVEIIDGRPKVRLNSDWLMWRKDRQRWDECGADGYEYHAQHNGHLIGCWRKTVWIPDEDMKRIRALAMEEFEE